MFDFSSLFFLESEGYVRVSVAYVVQLSDDQKKPTLTLTYTYIS